ncbi:MAG: proprotein convertase P-domain-containing protein [Bacteroidia bacterium]
MKTTKLFLAFFALTLASASAIAQITQTFVSIPAITIPAGAPTTTVGVADPYPSNMIVSGVSGTITDVNVILYDIDHTFPDDIDIILVSPTGQAVTLMSDCGSLDDITGVTLTFDDAAGAGLPDGTILSTGTYKPTDFTTPDNYPAPGPGNVSPAALLSTFNGYIANGTWSLYVVDDVGGDYGSIAFGWDLVITSTGCELVLPSGTDEAEACGTHTNDGLCYYSLPYGNISCGETVTGTQFFNSGTIGDYDSDEFQFTVTATTNVTITYNSEYPLFAAILDLNSCGQVVYSDLGTSCTEQSFTQSLAPGNYAILLEPSFANSPFFVCGGLGNDYYVTLDMDPVTPIITAGGPTTFCEGGSVTLTSTAGTSYLWSPGGATTQSISATASGSYTVTTTVNGCTATTSAATVVTVTPNTPVTFSGLNSTYCDNDLNYYDLVPSLYGGTFSGTGIVGNGDAYAVTVGTPLAITDNAPAGIDYTITPTGLPGTALGTDYFLGSICFQASHSWVGDLKVTLTSPNGTPVVLFDRPGVPASTFGCSGNDMNVTFIPGTGTELEGVCNGTVPTISGSFTAFNGADLNALNDGSDPNGTWILNVSDNGAGDVGTISGLVFNFGTNGVFDPLSNPGTHTITYDYANCAGCLSTTSQTTTVNAAPATPTITAGGPLTFCENGSVTLTSSSATGNVWTPGGATTQAISATASGLYSVTVTANGCSATSGSTQVTVNPAPSGVYSGLSGPYCANNNSTILLTPNAKGGTFSGPGVTGNGNAASASLTGTPVAITDNLPAGVNATVTPSGVAGTALGTDQYLTSICLSITHTWVGDLKATLTSPNGTPVVLFDRVGVPNTTVGCSGNNIDVIFVPGTGNEMESVCNPTVPTISGVFNAFNGANINSLNDGSNPNGTWTLNVSDAEAIDVGSIASFTLNFGRNGGFNPSVAGAGTHTITYTNTACNGCSGTTTQQVTVTAAPTATISGTAEFCTGGSTTLTSSSATGNVWSPGGATTQSITVTTANSYSVTVTANGCSETSAATTVTENPLPATPTITAGGPTTFCDPGSVTLTSSSATGNVWSPGGATTQAITADATGSYTVTVTDGNGCVSAASAATDVTEEICIGVNESAMVNSLNIFPNPAADNLNIEFTSNEVTCLEVRMTNTMGQLVYSDVKTAFSGTYKNTFSVAGFATGNYNLQVITDKEMMNKKVIIK